MHRNAKPEDNEVKASAERNVDIVMDGLGNNLAMVNIRDTGYLLAYLELFGAVQRSYDLDVIRLLYKRHGISLSAVFRSGSAIRIGFVKSIKSRLAILG